MVTRTCVMIKISLKFTKLFYIYVYIAVLPKRFSTATQFLERQFIATHIALMDKRRSSKKKKIIYNIRRILCALFFYPFLIWFWFFTFPFLMIFNLYIIKKSHFRDFSLPTTNRLATHQFGKRWYIGYMWSESWPSHQLSCMRSHTQFHLPQANTEAHPEDCFLHCPGSNNLYVAFVSLCRQNQANTM
jgi:hypothetical protein